MRKAFVLLLVVIPLFLGAGCKKVKDAERDREAIRVAIEKYLSERSGLNRSAMDVRFGPVRVEGNTAQAQVEFLAKGAAGAGFTMQMNYQLERQGDSWVVRSSRAGGDGSVHSQGGAAMPPTSAPATGDATGAGKLPAGHPPIGDAANVPAKKTPAPPNK